MLVEWRAELAELSFFRPGEAYQYGTALHEKIESNIERTPIFAHDAGVLAQVIYNARHSDHVEIGTFYGGSAILAAVVKEHFKLHGKVYCVDPLECRPKQIQDRYTEGTATTAVVMKNAEKFGVEDRIVLVPFMSHPWPIENKVFATGYIDGDHWNGMPEKDWGSLRKCVTHAIVFDDYIQGKPEVVQAVSAAVEDPEWLLVHASGSHVVFRRRE